MPSRWCILVAVLVPSYILLALVGVLFTLAKSMVSVKPAFLFSFPGKETIFCSRPLDEVPDSPRPDTSNSCKLYIRMGMVRPSDMLLYFRRVYRELQQLIAKAFMAFACRQGRM